MNLDNLNGLVGEIILESRAFEDSWGIPGLTITGQVLRGNHPEWQQHQMDLAASKPESVRSREIMNARIFSQLAPKGFRQKKKLSEEEAHANMLGKLAEQEKLQTAVNSLREQKAGIASILCLSLAVNGETVVTRGGVSHDLSTPAGRESFLSHKTWEFEQDGVRKEVSIPYYRKTAAGGLELDSFGEPVPQDMGGWNLGDAVAQLLIQEADDLAAFAEVRKADALGLSNDTGAGSTTTGSADQPLNDA
jgi:hypothetical protein